MIMEDKMIVEVIEIKNGGITKRVKMEVSYVEYDDSAITLDDNRVSFSSLSCDRIKLIVDDNLWLNKSFLKIDASSFIVGNEYEFSDDGVSWTKMELVSIDTDDELPFKAKKDSLNFGWRLVRALF